MPKVYHLDLDEELIEGATHALLPGDPGRAERIAHAFDADARRIASRREFTTYLGRLGGRPVLVTSTGIGGPSTSIAVDELSQSGVRTFLRVGSTGAIQPDIEVGDVVITSGSVRLDGASTHYAPIEYPAVAHHEIIAALIAAAATTGNKAHVGITASSATFYPGEERSDSFSGYVLRDFQGATEEWRKLNVLNYEMESATLLTMCAALGLRGGCVTGVVNRAGGDRIEEADPARGERAAIEVGVAAMERLVAR